MSHAIHIKLTPGQQKKLEPLHEKIHAAYLTDESKCGVILAQVFEDYMSVNFFSHGTSVEMVKILAKESSGGYREK